MLLKTSKSIVITLSSIAAVSFAGNAVSQQFGAQSDVAAIWNDPVFQKQFIGAYGINADVEPRVTSDEVKLLEKIRPLMADDMPKAEATLLKQLDRDPKCSAILDFTMGGICFQQDRMDEALMHYQTAVQKFPSFRRAWRNIGLIHARNGSFDDAIAAFTRMIELGGGDAYSYGLLGFAYASKQNYQASEAAYRNALLLQPENTEWRLGLTQSVFRQEKFQDAASLLDVLIERYPDKSDFWMLQAHTYLGMKQPLKAAENLEVVDQLGKASADSLFTLGDIYLTENLMDLAANAYTRAIAANASQPLNRALRSAELLASRGAMSQAQSLTTEIRKTRGESLDDNDRRSLLKLEARLSMAGGGGNEQTVKVLEEIVKIDPLDGEALMMLGQHYAANNEPDRAIFYFERAASIEVYEVTAKVRQAQVLVSMNRYADAVPLLRRVQEIKPRDDVARYLEQVDRMARSRR